jgi:hypothetical protein
MDMLDMVRDVLELAENTSCAALDPAGARGRSKQAVAQSHIERRAREVQQTFTLSCNMFDDVTLTPDVNGYLVFDGSTLSAEPGENACRSSATASTTTRTTPTCFPRP